MLLRALKHIWDSTPVALEDVFLRPSLPRRLHGLLVPPRVWAQQEAHADARVGQRKHTAMTTPWFHHTATNPSVEMSRVRHLLLVAPAFADVVLTPQEKVVIREPPEKY